MATRSMRPIMGMAIAALLATTLLLLFSLQQVTDTGAPKVARFIHAALERNLAEDSRTTLVVSPPLTEDGLRHYVLRFEPSPSVAANERALDTLVRRAAELAVSELGDKRPAPVVTCVAELPGTERRVTFSATLREVPEPAKPTPQGDEPVAGR